MNAAMITIISSIVLFLSGCAWNSGIEDLCEVEITSTEPITLPPGSIRHSCKDDVRIETKVGGL